MISTAILCIGDELLDGRVVDLNARHLIDSCGPQTRRIKQVRTVTDDLDAIEEALRALNDIDLVVVSGGLGPTSDDLTRQAAAQFINAPLVDDDAVLSRLRDRFAERNISFTDNNRRQCRFPDGATILPTEVGTAAGFRIDRKDTAYFFFPGVPREFRWFCERYLPRPQSVEHQGRRKMLFFGLGESDLEHRLGDLPKRAADTGVHLGFRASFPVIEILVEGPNSAVDTFATQIHGQLRPWLVAQGEQSIASRLGDRLVEAEATVSVAESCTAGLLGAKITSVSGSSRYFEEGYLTYSNRAKEKLLGVCPELLADRGAVSPQVVAQMAAGARSESGATFAVAISGIAGPTGGTAEKPVGTVDIGLATPTGVYVKRAQFSKRSRSEVRQLSVHLGLALLLWHLEDQLEKHRLRGPFSFDEVAQGRLENAGDSRGN